MKITALPRAATLRLERGGLLRFLVPALLALALYLMAFPASRAHAREDFCRYEPTVAVDVGGKIVTVQVWLGVPLSMRSEVDQAATNASVRAQALPSGQAGEYEITAWATVVTRSGAEFPVTMSLAVPSQRAESTTETTGLGGQQLSNSIRVQAR